MEKSDWHKVDIIATLKKKERR